MGFGSGGGFCSPSRDAWLGVVAPQAAVSPPAASARASMDTAKTVRVFIVVSSTWAFVGDECSRRAVRVFPQRVNRWSGSRAGLAPPRIDCARDEIEGDARDGASSDGL